MPDENEMTVKKIVAEWLREHGYSGLWDEECGCPLDDLMPCEGLMPGEAFCGLCKPGYARELTPEERAEGYTYFVGPERQEFVCTAEHPWTADSGPATHPAAVPDGPQRSDWPSGDVQGYKCPHCGMRFSVELPQ